MCMERFQVAPCGDSRFFAYICIAEHAPPNTLTCKHLNYEKIYDAAVGGHDVLYAHRGLR